MALIGKIVIAMGVDAKGLSKGLRSASVQINQFGHDIAMAGVALAGFGVVAAIGIGKAVGNAMNLGEQVNRADVAFGAFAGGVIKQAEMMADAFGVSKIEFIQNASALGQMFKGAGYSEQAAADLSVHFIKLATDLSSIVNIPFKEALEKIQSGLAGQVRPLRDVGVFMSEEAVQTYAVAHGMAKLKEELTEVQKVQARVGFITESLSYAQGDLAKTADSAANQLRQFWGEVDNLSTSLGQVLLPVVGAVLSDLNTGLMTLQIAWNNSATAAVNASMGVIGATEGQTQAIGFVQKAIGGIADAWNFVKGAFKIMQSYVTQGLADLMGVLSTMLQFVDKAITKLGGKSRGLGLTLKEVSKDLRALSGKQFEEAGTLFNAPPSEAIDKAFEEARKKTAALRAELLKTKIDVNSIKPNITPKTQEGKEIKFAHAMEQGSSEATNTILRSRYGGGQTNKENAKIAQNTGKSAETLKGILDHLKQTGVKGNINVVESFS